FFVVMRFLIDLSFCLRFFSAGKTIKFLFNINAVKKTVAAIDFLAAVTASADQFNHLLSPLQICTLLPADTWIIQRRGDRCFWRIGCRWRKGPQGRGTFLANNYRNGQAAYNKLSF